MFDQTEWMDFSSYILAFPSNACDKQELLYRYSSIDDPRFEKFLCRVWCLIKRYQVNLSRL